MHGGWHSLKPEVFIYFNLKMRNIILEVILFQSTKISLESSIDLMLLVCLHLFVYIFESDLLIYLLDLSSEIFVD